MTTAEDGLPPLREVIARHQLRARKSLGQNFLCDLNLTRKIARAAGPLPGHAIIEVGPGPGGLTRALLLEGADEVIAIERDERAIPALGDIAARWPGRLEIIAGDALKCDYQALAQARAKPPRIAANLPYNIATPLITGWLLSEPWPPWWRSMTVMVQREVAERLSAAPGGKSYGRLSVLAQWRARAERLFDVPPAAFTPPPKVTSSIVRISPLPGPVGRCGADALQRLTAAAFGQRRKMLRKALKPLWPDPEEVLREAGIAPTARAEELAIDDFCRLAARLDDR